MTREAPIAVAPERLTDLVDSLAKAQGFAEVVASLRAGHGATLGGAWGSSCALSAAALSAEFSGPLVVVLPHADEIDDFLDDLALFTTIRPECFPAWESSPTEGSLSDDLYAQRLRLLKALSGGRFTSEREVGRPSPGRLPPEFTPPRLIVTCIQALLQPVPRRETLARQTRRLSTGDTAPIDELAAWLVENGFQGTSAVELPGEFSRRGGILDIFAPDWNDPARIEFFDDEIESIRRFEVESQRSLAPIDSIEVTLISPSADDREHFTGYLPQGAWFMLVEPSDLAEEGGQYLRRVEVEQDFHSVAATMRQIYQYPSVTASAVPTASLETTCHLQIESVERFSGDIGKVRDELDAAGSGQEVFVICQTDAEAQRLATLFGETRLAQVGKLHFPIGRLKSGFRLVRDRIALVSGAELFHRADLARPSRRRLGRAIDSFLELREGDYVVHLSHGIGRYRGLKLLEKNGRAEEHLALEFQGETKIFVPTSKIELVQKYVGGGKSKPTLAKIGGRMWIRQKQAAEEAVTDLAADMIELQAARSLRTGISFSPDTAWQQEFDASFPYVETPDQTTAILSIKKDMQQTRPMDRLLCGDVGFGKTEVAMRAAFKAVDSGYQVAILAPTTVLVAQHLRTITARMAEFPFTIRALSRFSTPKEQKQTMAGLAEGSVDLVVGTHRLAQHDVTFQNLGLVIIDEEQRFGVEVKERLKTLRHIVDVLTMTATPIPRTLHLSLLGVRDISNLETPPEDRLAIETRVTRFEPELVRHAVMRELNRGGQVFFVHNRIQDIEEVARRLREIVPEANIRIGHGQMPEHELEEVMLDFINRRFDVLLATTIVESGLDIPNANTIFIDEADRYGLADMHQLRGRVGRYKHRAYAYLLIDPRKQLSTTAAQRLRAIEEFSDMGAGFAIAMRDLELRGAGAILGTQQSGHIATVGYELYCELLEDAIRRLKKLPPKRSIEVSVDLPGQAFLPRSYVSDMRLKIDLYRRLARVSSQQELNDMVTELADRFGPAPPEVTRILELVQVRLYAQAWQIGSIHLEDGFAVFGYAGRQEVELLAKRSGGRLRIVDDQSAYLPMETGVIADQAVLNEIKSLLRPA